MNRNKIQREHLYFIEDDIEAIEKDILVIPQEKLDRIFNKITQYAQNELLEIDILNTFLAVIQEKKEYYYQKQSQSYNYAAFKSAIIFMIILGFLMVRLYIWHNNDSLKHHQLTQLIEELKPYGITVKKCSKRYYKSTKYWLEVVPTKDLLLYQWIKAKDILHQIYELHSNIYGTNRWFFIIIFCGILLSIDKLFSNIWKWRRPRYKERYEKYALLEDKIEQKTTELSSKHYR